MAAVLSHALEEQYRIADAILRGTVITADTRPTHWPYAMIVDALGKLGSSPDHLVNVGVLFDALRHADADWPWFEHLKILFAEWDRVEEAVAERRQAQRDTIAVFGLIVDAEKTLDDRVTDLLAAREAAEQALETVNRAYALFEKKARTVFQEAA